MSRRLTLDQINERIARALGYTTWANGRAWQKLDWVDLQGDGQLTRTRVWSHSRVPNFTSEWKRAGELVAWLNKNNFGFYGYSQHAGGMWEITIAEVDTERMLYTGPTDKYKGYADEDMPLALCRAVIALLDARPELGGDSVVPGGEVGG